jgi:hypothetical protein
MTDLSPAALAVRDAAEKQTDLDFRYAPMIAAAALRAAADQVVPASGSRRSNEIRAEILAIAAELGGTQSQQEHGKAHV